MSWLPSLSWLSSSPLLAPLQSALSLPLKRAYKFVFKRLVGRFLCSELDLSQLDVALASGDVTLTELSLNTELLNSGLASSALPLRVTAASIAHLHARIPWRNLLTEHCRLQCRGLTICLSPVEEEAEGQQREWAAGLRRSVVLEAVDASLQGLDEAELRRQVRLHRRLADSISSAVRLRAVDPQTAAADAGAAAADEAEWGAEDGDAASAGLAVVASFLERLVAQTELTLSDLTVNVECRHPTRPDSRRLVLQLHIPSLDYSDDQQQHAASDSAAASSASTSNSAAAAAPSFRYAKRIALHGFRLSLAQPLKAGSVEAVGEESEAGEQSYETATIAHGDVDAACDVRLRVDMAPTSSASLAPTSAVDADVSVRSVRALLSPRQVQLLASMAETVAAGSRVAARRVERETQQEEEKAAGAGQQTSAAGGAAFAGAAAPLQPHDFDVIDDLLQARQSGGLLAKDERPAQQPRARFHRMGEGEDGAAAAAPQASAPLSPPSPSASASLCPSVPLWSVCLHLHHGSLTVLEEDEPLRSEWWLEPIVLPSSAWPPPSALLSPLIAGLSVDHLLVQLRHLRLCLSQSSSLSSSSLTVSHLRLHEYLAQYRLMQSVVPSLAAAGYEQRQQRLGFSARRLLRFRTHEGEDEEEEEEEEEEDEGGAGRADNGQAAQAAGFADLASPPHIRCDIEAAVRGGLQSASPCPLPAAADGEPAAASSPLSSRCCVQLAPVELELDLGLLSRLSLLTQPQSAPAPPPAFAQLSSQGQSRKDSSSSSNGLLFLLSASSLSVRLLFPADTASQSAVSTPLLRNGVPGCFDSRGLVRGERLLLGLQALTVWQQRRQQEQQTVDASWRLHFQHAALDLVYPKEDRQLTAGMRTDESRWRHAADGPSLQSAALPSHWHCARVLSTDYSLTAAAAGAPRPSSITVTIRAPLPPPVTFHSMAAPEPASSSASRSRSLEELLLHALPDVRWFEPAQPQPPREFSQQRQQQHSGSGVDASSSSSSDAASSSVLQFESQSARDSAVVVAVELSGCALQLSKVEMDLLLLLYAVYDEISAPPDAQQQPTEESEAAELAAVAAFPASPSSSASLSASSPRPSSPSLSDSDSDGSELFQSVVGAESVFLRGGAAAQQPERRLQREEDEDEQEAPLAALSDLDSGEEEEAVSQSQSPSASQYGLQSLLLGRSQLLTANGRRVVASSSSALFHSFVDAPPSLSASAVLPAAASAFVPAATQPYKHMRIRAAAARPPAASASASHRHRLCLQLSVAGGGICLVEEPVPLPLYSPLCPSEPVPASSSQPPQSFYLDVGQLQLFACLGLDGSVLSYVSVRAADATLREYDAVIGSADKWTEPSRPLLFRTLQQQQPPPAASAGAWSDPVFVGQFIIRPRPELHLRETTAVLSLRHLTVAVEPQHSNAWLPKLSDFLSLTCPPYVPTAGPALPLTADYQQLSRSEPEAQDGSGDGGGQQRPQPPPLTLDLCRLFFRAFSCCLDLNSAGCPARAALCLEQLSLSTTVHPLSRRSDIDMEVRDASLQLLPVSAKPPPRAPASDLRALPPPHLHRLPAVSLLSYLEELGCARVVSCDYLDVAIRQQDALRRDGSRPQLTLEMTNGRLDIATCSDSFATLLQLAAHTANAAIDCAEQQRQQQRQLSPRREQQPPPAAVEHNGGEDAAKAEDPEEEDGSGDSGTGCRLEEKYECDAGTGSGQAASSSASPSALQSASDAASALAALSLAAAAEEARRQRRASATSVSLALQAAAEREIEKVRREREAGLSLEQQQLQAEDEDGFGYASEQRARWFSPWELEERQWTSERDSELEEQLRQQGRERRRRRHDSSRRHQPLQPTVIDDHVSRPPASDDSDDEAAAGAVGAAGASGIMGQGRRRVRRLKLGSAAAGEVAETELILFDFGVSFRLFDGRDWREEEPQQPVAGGDHGSRPQYEEIVHGEQAAMLVEELDRESEADGGAREEAAAAALAAAEEQQRAVSAPAPESFSRPLFQDDYIPIPVAAAAPPRPSLAPSPSSSSASSVPVTPFARRGARLTDRVLELQLTGLSLLLASFPPSSRRVALLSIALTDAELLDCIASSSFKRLLAADRRHPGQDRRTADAAGRPLLQMEATALRGDDGRDDWRVEASVAPLRLHVDQDAAELLLSFFSHPLPALSRASAAAEPGPRMQLLSLSAPLHLTVDYRPHRVSFSSLVDGDFLQLLHLLPFEKLQLTLGAETVTDSASASAACAVLLSRWADELTRHQLHRYLSAVQPLRSLVNVGSGVVDCVVLPLEQWRRQRRLGSGVRKGVQSLLRNVTVESLSLLMSVTHTATGLLHEVDSIVSGPAAAAQQQQQQQQQQSGLVTPATASPRSLHDGLAAAYDSLSRSLQQAAHQLVAVPREEWNGAGGGVAAARSVVRHMPHILLGPCIGLTEGLRRAMQGMQMAVDAQSRSDAYK